MGWKWFLAGVLLGPLILDQLPDARLGSVLSFFNRWGVPLGGVWDQIEAEFLFRWRNAPTRRVEDLAVKWRREVRWESVLFERKERLDADRAKALGAAGPKLQSGLWVSAGDQGFDFLEHRKRVGLSADRAWAWRVARR